MSCGSEPGAQGETSRQPKTGKQIIQLRMSVGEGVVNRKHTAGDSNVEPSHCCFRTEFSTMTCTARRLGKVSGLVTTHNCSCHLHTAPPKRVREAKHLNHPLQPTPGHTSTLTVYKEQACPALAASKETCGLFSVPPVQQGAQYSFA